jgi:hypothetical protein
MRGMADLKKLTEAQRAYEARRAAKAGVSLDKWMAEKEKRMREEAKATAKSAPASTPSASPAGKKPGLLARLLERAQKPL